MRFKYSKIKENWKGVHVCAVASDWQIWRQNASLFVSTIQSRSTWYDLGQNLNWSQVSDMHDLKSFTKVHLVFTTYKCTALDQGLRVLVHEQDIFIDEVQPELQLLHSNITKRSGWT